MEFNKMYQKVKYIVRKCEKEYYIKLWEKDDWEQEGQLTLFELYQKNPEIGTNEELLYKYFKTKFRNHIKDKLRQQESDKRKINRMPYVEIGEISHRISSRKIYLDELVVLRDSLKRFKENLTIEEKVDEDNYILRLPNKEVRTLYRKTFFERYFGRGNKLSDLMEALIENKIDEYEERLQEILLTSVSYNDTKKGNEAFYHGLIMGMGLYLEGDYITKSNIESGLGRYDFVIEPKNKTKRAFIMEFKSTDSIENLEEVSKEALEQIETKKYDVSLKQNGIKDITYMGIAFCGKEIKIEYK